MTLLWFLIWFIADRVGSHEPLTMDPMNAWAATLILAVALDLGRQHAPGMRRRCARDEDGERRWRTDAAHKPSC